MPENLPLQRVAADLALCICTYKRPALLKALLRDVYRQTLQPGLVVIVDGDPASGEVRRMLVEMEHGGKEIWYVPSNHGNQTYQRYLGFRVCRNQHAVRLLYLDDDLQIQQPDAIENIVQPLAWSDRAIIAVTGTLDMGNPLPGEQGLTLGELRSGLDAGNPLIRLLGTSRGYPPGDVTPAGTRIPLTYRGNPYESVKWLRGGAIAVRVDFLDEKVLSDDIFAMNARKLGLCEDLILSRRLMEKGEILLAFNAVFIHPSETPPVAYSSRSSHLGSAIAYSRRWFNDNYRGSHPPVLSDRFSLARSYFGGLILNYWRALSSFKRQKLSYANGYLGGIWLALTRKPTARNLTPDINWWADAEAALKEAQCIHA